MKTNRELNQAHDAKEVARVRPASKAYDFKPLQDVVRQWITASK